MGDGTFKQVGNGRQPDMRMRPHVVIVSRLDLDRPEVIEENERFDALLVRQLWRLSKRYRSSSNTPPRARETHTMI